MIETRLLRYFLAVARARNITRAASALYITQATLSRQMMELEKTVGKPLFVRGGRSLTLTEEGRFLRERAKEILALLENTEAALRAEDGAASGDISIGCGETVVMEEIAALFARFRKDHPGVRLHIHSGDADTVLERLDRGLIDMGLLLGPVRQEPYDYLNLHRKDVFGLLMRRDAPLAAFPSVRREALRTVPLILSEQTFSGRQELDWFGLDLADLTVAATYNLIYNAAFLTEEGVGYAVTLSGLVNTKGRNLTFRPIVPELAVRLYIVTKKFQTFSPAAKAFLETLRAAAGEDSAAP